MRIVRSEFRVNPAPPQPMDKRKSAEVSVRSHGQDHENQQRDMGHDICKVLVCGASGERVAEIARFLTAFEYEPVTARSAETALQVAREQATQVAIWLETEVSARRGSMLDAARRLRGIVPGAESIVIGPTDQADYSGAAFHAGVYNCMSWPVDYANLARDLEFLSLEAQRRRELWLWDSGEREISLAGLVGGSPRMLDLFEQLRQLAGNNEPVLITGPVGSGKELAAVALHSLMQQAASGQAYHPLLIYRCCGLTEARAEELFAPRGVLGPVSGDRGLAAAQLASGDEVEAPADLLGFTKPGMVLIDEISDLPFAVQQKLAAWMLTTKAVRRPFPVRIVASTRCDLGALVQSGKFHAALYRLLKAQTVIVPALAERRVDIPMLVESFLSRYVKEQVGVDHLAATPELARDAQRALLRHHWPGNIRELHNAVTRAAMLAKNNRIEAADLGLAAPAAPPARVLDWQAAEGLHRRVWLN